MREQAVEVVDLRWDEALAHDLRSREVLIERWVRRWLDVIGDVLEGRQWLAMLLLVCVYVPVVLIEAHAQRLTNDEIYTVHISRAPTLHRMIWMAREIDLHPPLHYLLQRAALHVPGPMWLVSRLPSMLAGLVATLVLFRLTAQRLGNLLGIVSAAILWTGPVARQAWQNRPYMIWVALLSLLIVQWMRATRERRTGWDVAGIFLLSALMISDQLISVVCLLAFVLAEGVRWGTRGKVDWVLMGALLAPSAIGLGYFYQMRHLGQNSFPSWQIPSLSWAANMYSAMATQMFFLLSVSVAIAAYLGRGRKNQTDERRPLSLPLAEGVVYAGLIVVPVLLMVIAVLTKIQFWERYSSCAVVGLAGLVPWMLYRRVREVRLVSTVIVLCYVGTALSQAVSDGNTSDLTRAVASTQKLGRDPVWLDRLDPSIPIVDASAMTFTEMSEEEPAAVAQRVFYLTDRAQAEKYSGYTLFENEEKIRGILELRSHAQDFNSFVATHPKFYMVATYGRGTDWLPRALAQRGADMNYLGKFVSKYDDDDLFMVTVGSPQGPSTQVAGR
jgi:hypothetical protein